MSRIIHLFFDPVADVARHDLSLRLGNLLGLNHNTDLASRLQSKTGFDAAEVIGNRLQLLQTLEIQFRSLASGSRTGCTESVTGIGQRRINRQSLDLAMMRGHRIDHIFSFIVFPEDIGADRGMSSFNLVVNGFADIVEKTNSPSFLLIQSEFRGNRPHERGSLNRVLQNILGKAETEMKSSKQRQKSLRHPLNGSIKNSFLAIFKELLVNFLADFLDEFLNAGRMNTPIGDQLFEEAARRLLAEAGWLPGKECISEKFY